MPSQRWLVQKTEEEQFLCELPVATNVADATSQLVDVQNLRTRIHRYPRKAFLLSFGFPISFVPQFRLKLEGEELAKFGPAKPVDQQGIDEYADQAIPKGKHYQQDPTGRRTGEGT